MFFLYLPFFISSINTIVYGSSVQLKNVDTKNRLGVSTTTNSGSYQKPLIYSSRPPYDEGWLWTIEPDEETENFGRSPVHCNSIITLSNTRNEVYLSTKKTKNGLIMEATTSNQGTENQWLLKCPENKVVWEQMMPIQLFNLRNRCYLTTDFKQKIGSNKFSVSCINISSNSVWKVAEGIFFSGESSGENAKEPKRNTPDEL